MRGRYGYSYARLEEQYVRSFSAAPAVIVLDIDSTDDPTHGHQQLSFFHGSTTSTCFTRWWSSMEKGASS